MIVMSVIYLLRDVPFGLYPSIGLRRCLFDETVCDEGEIHTLALAVDGDKITELMYETRLQFTG